MRKTSRPHRNSDTVRFVRSLVQYLLKFQVFPTLFFSHSSPILTYRSSSHIRRSVQSSTIFSRMLIQDYKIGDYLLYHFSGYARLIRYNSHIPVQLSHSGPIPTFRSNYHIPVQFSQSGPILTFRSNYHIPSNSDIRVQLSHSGLIITYRPILTFGSNYHTLV